MPFNGSGVFQRVRNWVADATAGVKIRADFHDTEDDGFAAGLTNCITKDGQTIVTQNIPMNSKRITGLEDPVNPQDAATMAWAMPKSGGTVLGDLRVTGELYVGYEAPTGVIRFNTNTSDHYLFFDGTKFILSDQLVVPAVATGLLTATGGIEVGPVAGMPGVGYIDFHNGSVYDYNARIAVGGGTNELLFDTQGARSVFNGPVQIGEPGQGPDAATVNYVNGRTSFTPVQQGGGIYQLDNKIYLGWDGTGIRAMVDGTDLGRIFTESSGIHDGRLAFAGDWQMPYNGAAIEPFSGAVATGATGVTNAGPTYVFTRLRMRYLQLLTTSWYTVGYTA